MMNELVFKGQNGQVLTNSLLVAGKFGKEPNDVVRTIDNLLQSADNECNAKVRNMFVEYTEDVPQPNGGVKSARRFIMNRDGFTLLAMGFTGKKALKFKLEYIAAFNAMEETLKQHLSSAQMFAMQANINLEYEKRIENVENEIAAMKKEREENGRMLLAVSVSNNEVPKPTLRARCNELARTYAIGTNTDFRDVWHSVYNTMYYSYGINIKACKRLPNDKNLLDVAERKNHLGKIYDVLSNMVKSAQLDVK